jgi:primosomal protein N' (replication factor Y)
MYDEKVFLTSLQTSLISWISQFYFCLIHQSATLFFPKNLRGKIEKKKFTFKNHAPLQYVFSSGKKLNDTQNSIFQNILTSEKKKFFLYGVTGSGKTEIYIHLMKHYIDQGKQVLLLVPEIILTNQIFERIQKVF